MICVGCAKRREQVAAWLEHQKEKLRSLGMPHSEIKRAQPLTPPAADVTPSLPSKNIKT